MTDFADAQDISYDTWGSLHLFIGGKDVSFFRGVPAVVNGYQLTEPYSFGPADFTLPQVTQFEVDAWGTGALKWFGLGKAVVLKQVSAGSVVRVVWRGLITNLESTTAGTLVHCDGDASGRLSNRVKNPDLFVLKRHVGRKIFDAFKTCRLTLTPYLGADVGELTDGRGMAGWYIDYVDALLALTIDTDGSQYTISYRETQRDYHLALKDTTTVDFTLFLGAHGVDIDLASDLTEQPTTFYGTGVSPGGLVWYNGRYPGVLQAPPPPYPFTDDRIFGSGTLDGDTDTGDGITVMLSKLVGVSLLRRTDQPDGYASAAVEAIKRLQGGAGLPIAGLMSPDTWDALYDISTTGFSLLDSRVAPLAELSAVRKWDHTGNGGLKGHNPDYDPTVEEVDRAIDFGTSVELDQAARYCKGVLARAQAQKNWAGTITLTSDVWAGTHTHGSSGTPMSRMDVTPGMNVRIKNFDGGTLAHVSAVNVNVSETGVEVVLAVDTQARDAATLGEVIARRIESRSHPARQWRRQRQSNVNFTQIQFSEIGGELYDKWTLTGNAWNVIPVFAGQAGSVSRVRVQLEDDAPEFVLALTALKTTPTFWQSRVGNPFTGVGVSGVNLTAIGSGYSSAPTVSFSGGGGTGATGVAHILSGHVTSVVLTDRGTGYTVGPTVTVSGGGGSGATATASVTLKDPWSTAKVQPLIDKQRALLGAWGTAALPCGYAPGKHTDNKGVITADPITGLFVEDAGFDYHTFDDPVLYMAIFPDRDCVIKPQKILWDLMENGA